MRINTSSHLKLTPPNKFQRFIKFVFLVFFFLLVAVFGFFGGFGFFEQVRDFGMSVFGGEHEGGFAVAEGLRVGVGAGA